MTIWIESSAALVKLLGNNLSVIRKLDPWCTARAETKRYRTRILKAYDECCILCRRSHLRSELEIAHLIPLEVGGRTTEDNLIVLCKRCHHAYDDGHYSIRAMMKVKSDWKNQSVPKKDQSVRANDISTIRFPPPSSIREIVSEASLMQSRRHCVKGIRLINQYLSANLVTGENRVYLLVKCAELARRRAAQGAVGQAFHFLETANDGEIPPHCKAQYFYELGFVNRIIGNHRHAAELMGLSAQAALQARDGMASVEYVAAATNEILCKISLMGRLEGEQSVFFEERLATLGKIATQQGTYWGARWALNCIMHVVAVKLKAGDSEAAWRSLGQLREGYLGSDLKTGWDSSIRPFIAQFEGLVHLLHPRNADDRDSGIALLARAFISRLGPSQRPEGLRDVGFGLAIGFRWMGGEFNKTADAIEDLMRNTLDGTSVLWPCQQDNVAIHSNVAQIRTGSRSKAGAAT